MTEQEWMGGIDPNPMLRYLRSKWSERKVRLFWCACCRRIWQLIPDDESRRAVEVAERLADGQGEAAELADLRNQLENRAFSHIDGFRTERANNIAWDAISAVRSALDNTEEMRQFWGDGVGNHAHGWAYCAVASWLRRGDEDDPQWEAAAAEQGVQADLLRDIIGNPFRAVAIEPSWRTSDVVLLSLEAYQQTWYPEGDLDAHQMLVLSDAVEEAGCTDAALLDHLRSPGPHVRGCWALDLILGKQ